MSAIHVIRPHTLGLEGARRAADDVAARLRSELGIAAEWQGDVLHVHGHGVTGRLTATPVAVDVQATLSLAARPFRRLLLREIERELDRALLSPSDAP